VTLSFIKCKSLSLGDRASTSPWCWAVSLASALALVIACRRVPGPLSAVLDTVNTVAQSEPEVRNNRNEKTKTFFSKQQVISEASSDAIFLINEVVNIKFMRLSLNFGYLNVKALSMIHQFFVFEKLC
jgi:hypothetical protein